jgi:putative hydrolase of the HAD superfamily
MASRRKYLIWDFDGTLGYRPGQWSGALVQVLRRYGGRDAAFETLRPFMQKGFPWHNPNRMNPPTRTADDWWNALLPIFEEAFVACRVPPDEAKVLAGKVRSVYTDVAG